jgi:glycosyltransferase involved in cell wall biosynthesis
MDVSTPIATWNRAKSLDRTLRQLCRLRVRDGVTWELLVAQNDCTDETPAVIESYTDRLPTVGLVEPALGISNARNSARRAAQVIF